ncbi:class I SAM-dependent methyltransferase [Mesorhizobium kowhaii]|uniref:SAM-dependent methyltransferase n=1 Tax=Mesorhizobium kowhaii TaxID=1300272 RepID=A0A2W7CC04_9HYPH|nr:class I SAM-dependent methyltransferase [Mesorhizobium kowhaii]PZV40504.1 SAM-dependent methyltransferase [Mesorhizobium kowhaii]
MLVDVAHYYAAKMRAHGPSPKGVDWNTEEGQALRFAQLTALIDLPEGFTVNDLGCGYGALFPFLARRFPAIQYRGCDVAPEMIEAAAKLFGNHSNAHFTVGSVPLEVADFGFASGIFNVRLTHPDEEWAAYLEATLDVLHATSRRGFAFNCLTSYSDPDKRRADLYYADPRYLFDVCKTKYAQRVALLHDYGLYEFTILVRKT